MMHSSNDRPEMRLFVRRQVDLRVAAEPRDATKPVALPAPASFADEMLEEVERWDGLS